MAVLKPFAALRPRPELAERICELPYDVMSSEEARVLAAGNPLSFLHVSKPEIDLAPGVNADDAQVYRKGRENFDRLISEGALRQEGRPCFYLYRQIMGGHSQTGLVAAASCEDYLSGVIKKHELTRPDKEDDRVRHIEALGSQTGPVFLVYRAAPAVDELVARQIAETAGHGFHGAGRHPAYVVDAAGRGRHCAGGRNVREDSVSLHCRRPSSVRGGGAGFSSAQRRGPQRTFSRGDFSRQPDANPSLQPRVEGSERPFAGAIVGRTGDVLFFDFRKRQRDAQTETRTRTLFSKANGGHFRLQPMKLRRETAD